MTNAAVRMGLHHASAPVRRVNGSRGESGFTIMELLVAVGLSGVLIAIAVPMIGSTLGNFRLGGDAHNVTNAISVAKMRAAATFTRSRLYVDLSTNSLHVETWDSASSSWKTDGGTTYLATNDRFSFGVVGAPPSNTQTTIGEAAACLNTATPAVAIGNTACVVFNSRGIPVDASTLNPTGNYALYVTDGTAVYASTVAATGSIRLWRTGPTATPNWTLQ
jgi:prepilin-type N-terminal cleavage/methylation domain-containing protein